MSGQLCLKWNNHSLAFNKTLKKHYLQDGYSDATIFCHGIFYPVHRIVLSTCSEYFEEMFQKCIQLNNKHPFIIVKDISPVEMEAILNYMYNGEVNVLQDNLPDLIKAAEAFKIKGLAVPDEEDDEEILPKRKRQNSSNMSKKSRRIEKDSASYNAPIENLELDQGSPDSLIKPVEVKLEPVEHDIEHVEILDNKNLDSDSSIVKEEVKYHSFENLHNIDDASFESESSNNPYEEEQDFSYGDNKLEKDGQSGNEDPSTRVPFISHLVEDGIELSENNFKIQDEVEPVPIRHGAYLASYDHCNQDGTKKEEEWKSLTDAATGQKYYKCLRCQYKTIVRASILKHYRKHTGEKPYKCNLCSYRAAETGNLNKHMKIHTGEKPFNCHLCSFRTAQKHSLDDHIRTHTGEKPFQCKYCPYKSIQKAHLRLHENTLHNK